MEKHHLLKTLVANTVSLLVLVLAVNSNEDRVVIVATIDNLLKGAATQCLQNINLSQEFGEYDGIPTESLIRG